MRDEFLTLNEPLQLAVQSVIEQARAAKKRVSAEWHGGHIYAYPNGDGIAWVYNECTSGRNVARGMR